MSPTSQEDLAASLAVPADSDQAPPLVPVESLSDSLSLSLSSEQKSITYIQSETTREGKTDDTFRMRDERRKEAKRRKNEFLQAKVSHELYEDILDCARQARITISQVQRNALTFYLHSLGYDRGLRQDLEATSQIQRRLKEMTERAERAEKENEVLARAKATVDDLHAGVAGARRIARGQVQFRTQLLQTMVRSPADAKRLEVAVRMWLQPDQRIKILAAAEWEARSPQQAALMLPPILRLMAATAGGVRPFQAALAAETGVSA